MKQRTKQTIYLIDGVRVPRKVYFRRQIWGEHTGASFRTFEQ